MPDISSLLSDPEIMMAMQNPKVLKVLQEMMAGGGMPDPSKVQQYMADPDVGPVFQKLLSKFGGAAPGMSTGVPRRDDDDIPDMGDGSVDLDDLPDLE